jgi:hypothetical protein
LPSQSAEYPVPGALRLGLFPVLGWLRGHFDTTSFGRQGGNHIRCDIQKLSAQHSLLHLYLFLRHRIYPPVFITERNTKYGGRSRGSCQYFSYRLKSPLSSVIPQQVIDNGSGMCKAGCECSTESFSAKTHNSWRH